MSMLKLTVKCLFTPKLEKIYRHRNNVVVYQPHKMEQWGDKFMMWVMTGYYLLVYTSPIFCFCAWRREYFSVENVPFFVKLVGAGTGIYALSLVVRAIGRARNPKYLEFLEAFSAPEPQKVSLLRQYDFDFKAFPTTFVSTKRLLTDKESRKNDRRPWYSKSLIQIMGFIAVHTFGLRLIYPGAIKLITTLIRAELVRCRAQIMEMNGGIRHKVRTADGNDIDCVLIDNRATGGGNRAGGPNGNTLVICCEGNSGFYEMGILPTPLSGGYSTLGWNHPGFAGSTGLPYPQQEKHAIDAIMQLAIHELDFPVSRIVLYGWSIGGYAATWAAVRYPDIQCLVLDATFDDLLPLALARMPRSWAPLVREVVRGHVDLNITELLLNYPGPLRLVRRLNDEIICVREGDLSSNRVNHLLTCVLFHRHPEWKSEEAESTLFNFLALQGSAKMIMYHKVLKEADEKTRNVILLAQELLEDFNSAHCNPLPIDHFVIPSRRPPQ